MKKLFSGVLSVGFTVSLLLSGTSNVYASELSDFKIDKKAAEKTVYELINQKEYIWLGNENEFTVKLISELYGLDNQINSYYYHLINDEEIVGYVLASGDSRLDSILEYGSLEDNYDSYLGEQLQDKDMRAFYLGAGEIEFSDDGEKLKNHLTKEKNEKIKELKEKGNYDEAASVASTPIDLDYTSLNQESSYSIMQAEPSLESGEDFSTLEPPLAEGEEPPVVEGEEPPVAEGEEPPVVEGEEPPVAEGEEPPVVEGEEFPVLEEGKTPVIEENRALAQAVVTLPVYRVYQYSPGVWYPKSSCGPAAGASITNYYQDRGFNVRDSGYYGTHGKFINHLYVDMNTQQWGSNAYSFGTGLKNHLNKDMTGWFVSSTATPYFSTITSAINSKYPVAMVSPIGTGEDYHWRVIKGYDNTDGQYVAFVDPDGSSSLTKWSSWGALSSKIDTVYLRR